MLLLLMAVPAAAATIYAAWWAIPRAVYVYQVVSLLQNVVKAKTVPKVVASLTEKANWAEPPSAEERFGNSTRILWGFWNKGRENMPGICELGVQSWEARNPGWEVIILSDENYKNYVSASDVPTTFDCLKVQHQSDIIRLAVLVRYGGAYMDVSTVIFKGFDAIWDDAPINQLLLTAPAVLSQDPYVPLANNALIFAPTPTCGSSSIASRFGWIQPGADLRHDGHHARPERRR